MTRSAEAPRSMTGFGRSEGTAEGAAFRWELRSVNAKGLDLKFRLPNGFEGLEPALRASLRQFHRGTIHASLKFEEKERALTLEVDEAALAAAAAALGKVRLAIDCERPRPEAVLQMPGVLRPPENGGPSDAARASVLSGFDSAAAALLSARAEEGARIAAILGTALDELLTLVDAVRQQTEGSRAEIAARIRSQITDLLAQEIDEDRLAQEAAMLAVRADVTEELDRLSVHARSFKELLAGPGPAGRRLEFLTQELMREASTMTVKLHNAALKNLGLDIKERVDGLKEQVLNLA